MPTWHMWEQITDRQISLEALLELPIPSGTVSCGLVHSHDIRLIEHFGLRVELALTLQVLLLVK